MNNWILLALATALTLGISAACSMLEAFILSMTPADIEQLKRSHPKRGARLDRMKLEVEENSTAILTLNTIANSGGALVIGALAVPVFGDSGWSLLVFNSAVVVGVLLFSEILPKTVGVNYRRILAPYLVLPLQAIRVCMFPVTFLGKRVVGFLLPKPKAASDESVEADELALLAHRHSSSGALSLEERDIITNALKLDDLDVHQIMTPRTVVCAVESAETVAEVFQRLNRDIPFGRLPVYDGTIDNIVGIVRRRDLLRAQAEDRYGVRMGELCSQALIIPANASAADALQSFLKHHQQLAVVVDEYGSMAGVIAMEDVIENILGREIYEPDDVAVDMREYALRRVRRPSPPQP